MIFLIILRSVIGVSNEVVLGGWFVFIHPHNIEIIADIRLLDQVGVILNLTPDHLERHKTMETYGKMKCRIFAQMGPANLAVIPQCKY